MGSTIRRCTCKWDSVELSLAECGRGSQGPSEWGVKGVQERIDLRQREQLMLRLECRRLSVVEAPGAKGEEARKYF